MKLDWDKIEDLMTTGIAKAAKAGERHKVYLLDENPTTDDDGEKGTLYINMGYVIKFAPDSYRDDNGDHDEAEPAPYYKKVVNKKESVYEGDFYGWGDFAGSGFEKNEYTLQWSGIMYVDWETFAKAYGANDLFSVATKIPAVWLPKMKRVCKDNGETVSWRIRLLIQDYLEEDARKRAKRSLFE